MKAWTKFNSNPFNSSSNYISQNQKGPPYAGANGKVRGSQKSLYHPLGIITPAKFHANTSLCCWDISVWWTNLPAQVKNGSCCFISTTKQKVGTAASAGCCPLSGVQTVVWSKAQIVGGWVVHLINNWHMAHTLHKAFQCRSKCWKHTDGYQIGCTVRINSHQPTK